MLYRLLSIVALLSILFMNVSDISAYSGKVDIDEESYVQVQSNDYYKVGQSLYEVGDEVIEKRTENSKTKFLGKVGNDNKFSLDVSMAPIHYKDNYSDSNEQWKDIDLTPVNGVVTKAPYILVIDGAKVTVTDKRTGSVVNLELTDVGNKKISKPTHTISKGKAEKKDIDTDTDLEITWENARVKVTRVLKSDKAAKSSKFNISQTGNGITIGYRAEDSSSDIIGRDKSKKITASISNGVLTETIDTEDVVYPLRVDPTIDVKVAASADDANIHEANIYKADGYLRMGNFWIDGITEYGCSVVMRFTNINIDSTATISTSYITFKSNADLSGNTVNLKIYGQQSNNANTFSTYADYTGRATTTATVSWNSVGGWTDKSTYNTPSINSIIGELVTDYSGLSSANIAFFVLNNGSSTGIWATRDSYDYDSSSNKCPNLHIEYTVPVAPTVTSDAAASSVADTTMSAGGDISSAGGVSCTKIGIVYSSVTNPPTVGGASCSVQEHTGTYTGGQAIDENLSSLSAGTTYYWRAYAYNSVGYGYGATRTQLMKPAAPTGVAASENSATEVLVSWTKSTGATDYHVFRGAADLGSAGDVDHIHDTGAGAPLITAGVAVASDGASPAQVNLSLSGTSVANGSTYSYTVVASNATGSSSASSADNGYRLATALTYQWNRSAADSDASYSAIGGATASTYADTGAPAPLITAGASVASDGASSAQVNLSLSGTSVADGAGRYYTCTLVSTGASNTPATATANRGYRVATALTYQWQRSSGTGDSGYGDIGGATSSTYADTAAPAPLITAGSAVASDGTDLAHVDLSLSGTSVANGAVRYYKCTLVSTGASNTPTASASNDGYRVATALTYQWKRSDADSAANYNTNLGTASTYEDTGAPSNGDGRYYICTLVSTNASNTPANTVEDRGYRDHVKGRSFGVIIGM